MEGSSKARAAPLPRMQERRDLRFGAASRVDFVRGDSETVDQASARAGKAGALSCFPRIARLPGLPRDVLIVESEQD